MVCMTSSAPPRRWHRFPLLVLGAIAICGGGARGAQQDPGPSFELRVNHAIARGLKWLVGKQSKDGTWPGHEDAHPGGMTALACLALVKSGVARDDVVLYAGLKSLQSVTWKSVYSASVFLMLTEALDDKKRTQVGPRECLDFLVKNQKEGMWAYPEGYLDMSNTQFALLGLR